MFQAGFRQVEDQTSDFCCSQLVADQVADQVNDKTDLVELALHSDMHSLA